MEKIKIKSFEITKLFFCLFICFQNSCISILEDTWKFKNHFLVKNVEDLMDEWTLYVDIFNMNVDKFLNSIVHFVQKVLSTNRITVDMVPTFMECSFNLSILIIYCLMHRKKFNGCNKLYKNEICTQWLQNKNKYFFNWWIFY